MKQVLSVCFMVGLTLSGGMPVYAAGEKCHLRELDLCAATAVSINKVPVTEAEVERCCGVGIEAMQCVTTFLERCATPLQREVINFVIEGPMRTVEKFCTKGDELRSQYLQRAPCLAKAQPNAKKCFQDVRTGLERMAEVNVEDRITTACCIYSRYKKCATDVFTSQCGESIVEFGEAVAKMAIGSTVNVICQDFDKNPACDSLLPPPGTKATGKSKSVVARLFSVYATM